MRQDVFAGSSLLFEPIRAKAHDLDTPEDLDPLFDRIGDARLVLLGEASHGTSEYYSWRAHITRELIQRRGFSFVAVEGDWPDCYRVNRFVKGYDDVGQTAVDVLHGFDRWPTWMWANWEMAAFTEWLQRHNRTRLPGDRVGFYGLDVYSLWDSMEAVVKYLQEHQPDAVEDARRAYQCFDPFGGDPQQYAYSTVFAPDDCHDEVVKVLVDLRQMARHLPDPEEHFDAEQNALVAVEAERYYRTMIRGDAASWNIRDTHMADTLDRLLAHHGAHSKGIVWEHNTHIGDARATDMEGAGMVNIGQLARERHGEDEVVLVGFSSHRGSVIASRRWGDPMEVMQMPPARQDSWEAVLHEAGNGDSLLITEDFASDQALSEVRGHRAIGVVYNPEREALGNYVPTLMLQRYDAFIYLEETHALHPLHISPHAAKDPPETYPWGI